MSQDLHTLSCEDATMFVCEAVWGFAEVDKDGKFAWVNRSYCETLNAPAELILGTHFKDWTHPDDIDIDLTLAEQVVRGERKGYTLAKRYRKYGYPPQNPRYTWGILSVQGKWNETGEFSGFRVQYREYNHLPPQGRLDLKSIKQKLWVGAKWTLENWKAALTILAIATSLMSLGSEKLLNVLDQARDTAESVESVLQPLESSLQHGSSEALP